MQRRVARPVVVALLVTLIPQIALAQPASPVTVALDKMETSFSFGPVAMSLQMTKPVNEANGMVWNTLHIEVRDDTQAPRFNGSLDAIAEAADANTLFVGFPAAVILVAQDLAAGMSFSAAAADASQKTHVTVRSFNDASMVEYALLLVAVLLLAAASYSGHIVSPLSGQLAIIANGLQTSLDAIGGGGVIP